MVETLSLTFYKHTVKKLNQFLIQRNSNVPLKIMDDCFINVM